MNFKKVYKSLIALLVVVFVTTSHGFAMQGLTNLQVTNFSLVLPGVDCYECCDADKCAFYFFVKGIYEISAAIAEKNEETEALRGLIAEQIIQIKSHILQFKLIEKKIAGVFWGFDTLTTGYLDNEVRFKAIATYGLSSLVKNLKKSITDCEYMKLILPLEGSGERTFEYDKQLKNYNDALTSVVKEILNILPGHEAQIEFIKELVSRFAGIGGLCFLAKDLIELLKSIDENFGAIDVDYHCFDYSTEGKQPVFGKNEGCAGEIIEDMKDISSLNIDVTERVAMLKEVLDVRSKYFFNKGAHKNASEKSSRYNELVGVVASLLEKLWGIELTSGQERQEELMQQLIEKLKEVIYASFTNAEIEQGENVRVLVLLI